MRSSLAAIAVILLATQALAQTPGDRILVVPFDNVRHEPRLHWVGEASAVLLADELNASGLRAITRDERVRAFEQLRLPPGASLSRATVIKVGQLLGASEVIIGTIALQGTDLAVEADTIRIDVGRLQPQVRERAALADVFALFERLARRLAPDGRQAAVRAARPPLDAFENYVKGLIAESPARQATFLETAISQSRDFDRAHLALWHVRSDQGDHAAALAAARAVRLVSPLYRRAMFAASISLLELKRYDDAFDGFTGLIETAPASAGAGPKPGASVLNNLGVLQIRRGATPQTGTATHYLTKAADLDPGDADGLFNLGYAYVLERNPQAALYWLREALRRDPTDADAHVVLAAALRGTGSVVEAAREQELARQLASRYEDLGRGTAPDKVPVPRGLERVRTELDAPRALRPEQTVVDSAQREQRELAVFHLDRGRRLYEREEDREALAELKRAIYLSPYEATAHLLIGRIHLRAGHAEEAIDALKISVWSQETAAARIVLAECYLTQRKTEAARIELERALMLDPESAEAKRILSGLR